MTLDIARCAVLCTASWKTKIECAASRTCSTTNRIGLISDSPRARQQVGQQQSALGLKARSNPCRDSVACTIVMRLQRRLKSYFSDDQTLYSCITTKHSFCSVHVLCKHLAPTDESACNPNRRAYAK